MLFSDHPRTHYEKTLTHEVICQLRFPTILTINNVEPADFQERIREDFPQYVRKQDMLPPRLVNGKPEPQPPVTNYHFLSQDGKWKLNLTKDFIALSTLSYPGWEEFARMLDKPLAAFIQLYKPAYFQRVGLRYLNIISRKALDLEGTPWHQLIAPAYLGALAQEDVGEDRILSCGYDLQVKLDSSCAAKIHAGTGRLKVNNPNMAQDSEVKFILDGDFSTAGKHNPDAVPEKLERMHRFAVCLFQGAITKELHEAMGPTPLAE